MQLRDAAALTHLVRRLHSVVAVVALVAVTLAFPLIGARWWPTALGLVALLALARSRRLHVRWLFQADLFYSLTLWWLFGPVSGAGFLLFGAVSAGAFVLTRTDFQDVLAVAGAVIVAEVGLHFLSRNVALPLFHPPDPVPEAEFLLGVTLQLLLLLAVGTLLARRAGWRTASCRMGSRSAKADR